MLFYLLLWVAFLHGVFSSGFIPILNHVLGEQSSWAFAIYFMGLLLGQLAVYRFRIFSARRWSFTLYELIFGGSLVLMGIFASGTVLTLGRGLEGLAGGFATPLLFAQLVKAPNKAAVEQKIVRYNGIFALGFVLGPVIVELTMKVLPYRLCLIGFGLFFMLLNLLLSPLLQKMDSVDEASLKFRHLFAGQEWFEKFYSLFYAKSFYGFLLSFVTSFAAVYFARWPISALTVSLAVLFICGQQLASRTLFRFHKQGLEILLPLGIGLTLMVFWLTQWPYLLFLAALQHSYLLFIAFLNFTTKMKSGREFALFNSLSDPGMILGALLAGLGLKLVWVLLLLGAFPLLYYRRIPELRRSDPLQKSE